MSKIWSGIQVIFALAVLCGIAYGTLLLLALVKGWFDGLKLNPTVTQAIVIGLFTFAGVLVGKTLERRDQIESQLREKKLPIYEEFIQMWFVILKVSKSQQEASQNDSGAGLSREAADQMVNMAGKLLLWGSNGVIKKYSMLRVASGTEEQNAIDKVFEFENVLKEIRKDLGHSTFGLKRGELLRLFINDMDSVIAAPQNPPRTTPKV